MDNSKKFKHNNLNEGESPEENNILDDLQVLVNRWREDNTGEISPIASLQQLIDDYYSTPLNEMVNGDQEWHTKEQGDFFTLDGSENLGNTDYFKDDGFDIIHQTSGDHHLSDISPESQETYIPKGSKKVKKTVLKPRLDKGPFNVSILDEQHTEGDNVLGGESYVWNNNTSKHDLVKIQVPKERFFQLTKAIVSNFSLQKLKEVLEQDHYELEELIRDTIKLYGATYSELGGDKGDGLTNKIVWASVDNYEGLSNNQIDNFDSLVLRPLKTYKAKMSEEVKEWITYTWYPTVVSYDESQAILELIENTDGYFSWYEWDNEPGFERYSDDQESMGVNVDKIEEIKSKVEEEILTEDTNAEAQTVNEIDATIMNHLTRDYSKQELITLVHTNLNALPSAVESALKLYGFGTHMQQGITRAKQLLQLMFDEEYTTTDYKEFMGKPLPPLHHYTFEKSFLESETHVKLAIIEVADTNFQSAFCDIDENFWDYQPDIDYVDIQDSDFIGEEEWERIYIDDTEVWRTNDRDNTERDKKYNPEDASRRCI